MGLVLRPRPCPIDVPALERSGHTKPRFVTRQSDKCSNQVNFAILCRPLPVTDACSNVVILLLCNSITAVM